MAYRTDDLLQECAAAVLGTPMSNPQEKKRAKLFAMSFKDVTITTFDNVWAAVLQIIRTNMKIHRGTRLPNFGRVVFTKDTKKPFFVTSESFVLPNKIHFKQDIKAPELSSVDLNFSKIGQLAKCTKDAAKSVYRELVSRLGEVLSDANNTVHVQLKGIGVLSGNRFDLRFHFEGKGNKNKHLRPETTASFSKNAPASAMNLSVNAGVGGVGPADHPSLSLSSLSNSTSLPSIKKGLAKGLAITQKSRRSNNPPSSRQSRTSTTSNKGKGLKLNSLVAKKGHSPRYLNHDDLKEVNLSLLTVQRDNEERQRIKDEEEYRATVLRLHSEAANEGAEIKKNQERRQEFADAQSLHAQRVEQRKFEERNADIENPEIHWPFSKEEDERKRQADNKIEAMKLLVEQGVDFGNTEVREHNLPDPSNTDTWFQPSEGNIYPKFLTPTLVPSRIAGNFQATPVMKLGYQRYASDLKKELTKLRMKESEIVGRKEAEEAEIKRRHKLRKQISQKTIKYQAKQVEYDRKRKKEEHRVQFLEMDPEPGVAYPLERVRNGNRLNRIQAGLRNALDAQVHAKQTIDTMNKTISTAEDNYFLGCVQEQLELDRAFRTKKKGDEQKALMKTWSKQEAITAQVKKMEKMRDGLVVRNGNKVETIDDVSRVYESLLEDI